MAMRNVSAWVWLLCAAVSLPGDLRVEAQGFDTEEIVNQFYPARLTPDDADERYACYRALATSPGAPELLVAAYTDRSDGVVRVLRRAPGGTFEVVFDSPGDWDLSGRDCVVRLNDVDLDGQEEVFVYFFANRSSDGWIFRWDGSALENLTATEMSEDLESTIMLGPTVYDFHHDDGQRVVAAREIAITAPGVPPRNPAFVYRMGSEGLEVESTALAVLGFRADVDAAANQRFFRLVTDSAPPVTLRVINGDRDGRNRVTAATVTVNNEIILGPEQINADTAFVSVMLQNVFTTNELHADLTGPPDARLIVLIEDSTSR
jgi:hypothetical protein